MQDKFILRVALDVDYLVSKSFLELDSSIYTAIATYGDCNLLLADKSD